MKVTFDLSADEHEALLRFANESGEDMGAAARIAIREFLISVGMLEPESDGDNEAG